MDKVLIAEDDRIHLKRLTTVLKKYEDKFEVIPARDGQEAIDILKRQGVSLLVTDIQMPRADGLVLLAYVNEHHPNIPCFVMTAYGTPQMKAKLPKDLLRFFRKPFDIDDLALSIIDVLDREVVHDTIPGISLFSFLYMIEMEQGTCMFEISSAGKPPGVLYFENGILYDAQCEKLNGEAAALELFSREITTFRLKFAPQKEGTKRIQKDLNHLVRKAMIPTDEAE